MQAAALSNEAFSLFNAISAAKQRTVIQFLRFIAQQPDEEDSEAATDEARITEFRAARDNRDIENINANAEYLNAGAEENLEFQADILENEA